MRLGETHISRCRGERETSLAGECAIRIVAKSFHSDVTVLLTSKTSPSKLANCEFYIALAALSKMFITSVLLKLYV